MHQLALHDCDFERVDAAGRISIALPPTDHPQAAAAFITILVRGKTETIELSQQIVGSPQIVSKPENVVSLVQLGDEGRDRINAAAGRGEKVSP
jgi:hypothetical protein